MREHVEYGEPISSRRQLAIDGDGRHGSTKPIPAEAQTLEQHATNVGAAATISSAPAGTFLRAELFSRISQEVV